MFDSVSCCRPMEGAGSKVNKEMAAAQKVAGFEYNDFEASISKFDSAFQVLFFSCTTSSL